MVKSAHKLAIQYSEHYLPNFHESVTADAYEDGELEGRAGVDYKIIMFCGEKN